MDECSKNEDFRAVVKRIGEDKFKSKYDQELVLRFFAVKMIWMIMLSGNRVSLATSKESRPENLILIIKKNDRSFVIPFGLSIML